VVLTQLRLDKIDFSHCSDFGPIIRYGNLKKLGIYRCTRPDCFLDLVACSSTGQPFQLRSFTLSHEEPLKEMRIWVSIDGFLESFTGLEELLLRVKSAASAMPTIRITRDNHGPTLRVLSLGFLQLIPRDGNNSQLPVFYE